MIKTHKVYYPLYTDKDKFIILITGGRGCEHPDTPIMMSDQTVRKIKDIRIGESVMGDDGTPRRVLALYRGESSMYKVKQDKAEDYIVNNSHILVLRGLEDEVMEIPVNEYMQAPQEIKDKYFGYRVDKESGYVLSRIEIESLGKGKYCGLMLDGNQRYIHSDGTVTHNSGKSFSASTFIERLTFMLGEEEGKKIAHQILFTRYTMASASISVIPEFLEKVDADGTSKYFRHTKTDVVNKMTKSSVMFRGIKTSSGNQTAKLKSIHGITTFVCDEAEEWVSDKEFETIMLSIRQKGIQNRIIIIMNPTDSNHFIYQRYIKDTHKMVEYDGVPVQISTHPNVLHIHTTYIDNKEHLSAQFLKEVEDMKANDPERYAHTVIGAWADVAEGAVYKKWGIVDKFPDNAKKVAIGVDWGYTNDPTAIVKCGIVENRLYVQELCYKTRMGIKEIIEELKRYDYMVYADSADPRLIDEVALGGILIFPVEKGAGSVNAGIDKIQSMELFVTRNSMNLQEELRNYTWGKDKDGNYINQPIDAYNHGLDALRYYVLTKLLGRVMKPKTIRKSQTNIY